MPGIPRPIRLAVFILCSLLLALFLELRSSADSFTFSGHRFAPDPARLLIAAAVLSVLLVGLWALSAHFLGRVTGMSYKEALASDFWTWIPLLFLALSPLALERYLTRDDLRGRLGIWLAAVLIAVLSLKTALWGDAGRGRPAAWRPLAERFFGWGPRKKLPLLFLVSLLFINAASALFFSRKINFSGDEPHYILNVHSLLTDGDLDLADNYRDADYHQYEPDNAFIRPHTVAGAKPGSQYSFHSPGLSFFLVPFYALGRHLGKNGLIFLLRFAMSILGALFALQLYLYARSAWRRERLALGLWFLAAFTSPIFFYSLHVYPEIVVALFGLTVYRLIRFSEKLTAGRLLLCGFLLACFVWLHALKYFFILVPLFLYGAWTLIRKRSSFGRWAAFLAAPAAMAGLYLLFSAKFYGSLNPTAVSWQGAMDGKQTLGFLKDLLAGIPLRFRLDTLAGYFFDQRDGLFLYAPIYVFAFLGLVLLFRRKAGEAWLLLAVAAPYVLVSAFLTQRTGYAPQARPLVAVSWVLLILLGHYLAEPGKRGFVFLFRLAASWSFLVVWLLLQNPFALYQETTQGVVERGGDLFSILGNLHHSLTRWLPSFLKVEEWRWAPNFVWPALFLLLIAAFLLIRKPAARLHPAWRLALAALFLAGFFVWFVGTPRTVLAGSQPAALPDGPLLRFYNLSRVARMHQPARFSILEDNRDYNFYFASPRRLDKLRIEFGSEQGDYDLTMGFWDNPPSLHPTRHALDAVTVERPPAYRWGNDFLYRISLHLERRSEVRTGENPYQFAITPGR